MLPFYFTLWFQYLHCAGLYCLCYSFITACLTFSISLLLCWHSLQASLEDRLNHMHHRFKDDKNGKEKPSPPPSLIFLLPVGLIKKTGSCTLPCLDSSSTACLREGQDMLCGRMILRLPLGFWSKPQKKIGIELGFPGLFLAHWKPH